MTMTRNPLWEKSQEHLYKISKAFYQAYRLSGTVKMKFGVRSISDSDGNSVVDVYVSARDGEAASTLNTEDCARHMQFLENMVPAHVLGYQFILHIAPRDNTDIEFTVLEVIPPITADVSSKESCTLVG